MFTVKRATERREEDRAVKESSSEKFPVKEQALRLLF